MGTHKGTRPSSERKKWGEIFNSMVQMLRTRQTQLETLVKERKILECLVKMQQDRWVSDTRRYENEISQMMGDKLVQEMDRSFNASKFKFVVGLKDGDAQLSRLKHEHTESELEDFKAFFDVLCETCSALSDNHSRNPQQTSKSMEGDVRMLRQAYEKLKSEKDSEVSALVMEKKFVWNQYNIMEEDYMSKLRSKTSDVERANLTIEKLLGSLEELQKSNHEKDDSINTLKSEIGKRDTEKNKLKEEICRLANELELLRKSKTVSASPVLKCCNSNVENSVLVGGKSMMAKKDASSAKISHPTKNSKTGSRSSKRNRNEVIGVLDSPILFSSSIKIPKLKSTFHSSNLVNSSEESF